MKKNDSNIYETTTDTHYIRVGYGCVDEYGRPVERTKWDHPYGYDGFVVWDGRDKNDKNYTSTIYSDRMRQWDYDKYRLATIKAFGDSRQIFHDANPKQIEKMLQVFLDNNSIKLRLVMEYCNLSTGFPVWRFDYSYK